MKIRFLSAAVVSCASIALIACGGDSEPGATVKPGESRPVYPAPAPSGPSEAAMVGSMEAHYGVVILAHDALLQGDLEKFRTQLALVPQQELPDGAPARWHGYHEHLKISAAQAVGATDLESAASGLASVVLACGTCHAAVGSGPVYPAPAPDEGDNALKSAMLDHQWATERMWEGVTGPWDNAWQRGADTLSVTQVFGNLGPEVILSDELRARERALRTIGAEAKITTALDERAALYGRLLATCGACHRAIGLTFDESE